MVFTFGICVDFEYVVIDLLGDGVLLERVTNRIKGSNRHRCRFGNFEHPSTEHIRTMDEKELSCYRTQDPICDLEKGIYKIRKDIATLLDQPAVREDEVIWILGVHWDDYNGCQGEQYKFNIIYRQFGKQKDGRLVFHAEEKMTCVRWFRDNFYKIHIN
ncbi:hypothetical protein [Dysgonomonas sp. UBA7698]|uniref:hypothetical protein n=2 Tax=unclassified Dysgonomonas TaxID=2630389 RepID=UPI0025BB5E7D|nr:hypothetical protein [Dysgonomonas sp. UBA7698]